MELLEDTGVLAFKPISFPMVTNLQWDTSTDTLFPDPSSYRRLIGRLLYLTITHPSLSYAIQCLSQFMSTPHQCHMEAAHRLLRYLKATLGQGLSSVLHQT